MLTLLFFFILLNQFNFINNILYNINIKEISYELNDKISSKIKVIIFSDYNLKNNVNFNAYLKSEDKNNKLLLKCSNKNLFIIECILIETLKNIKQSYFFYYNCSNQTNIKFNNKCIYKDKNKISFIYKPYIYINQTLYRDKKIIYVKQNKNIVNNGYIYFLRQSKNLLKTPKDGFNKYIEINNYISSYKKFNDFRPLIEYKDAIKKGFHIVDADLQFTKDKIPIICHASKLDKISNGKGFISSKTLKELKKLNFFNDRYKGKKILTFEKLLKLCKDNNIIIDLDLFHMDFNKYFNDTDEYAKIIINIVKKYDMFNSVIFSHGNNIEKMLKLKKYKNDITISLSKMNEKKNIERIKDKYNDSKRVILCMGNLLNGKKIDYKAINYGLSLGKKIKAAKVNSIKFANRLFNWGVSYITTQNLNPFQLKNEKEEPTKVKCISIHSKEYSECKIKEKINLIDRETYNIYYSEDINNQLDSINEKPIGSFKYINTNINNKLYYYKTYLNFKKGIIKLIISNQIKKGSIINGIIGPDYDNVKPCYQFNFKCIGNNNNFINCKILKNEKNKIQFNGKYRIYSIDNYSFNENIKKFYLYKIFLNFVVVIILFILKILIKWKLI